MAIHKYIACWMLINLTKTHLSLFQLRINIEYFRLNGAGQKCNKWKINWPVEQLWNDGIMNSIWIAWIDNHRKVSPIIGIVMQCLSVWNCLLPLFFFYYFIRFTTTLFNYIIEQQNKTIKSIGSIICVKRNFCCRTSEHIATMIWPRTCHFYRMHSIHLSHNWIDIIEIVLNVLLNGCVFLGVCG